MKRIYTLFQQYIAYILLISFSLQSCGGFSNPVIPVTEEQTAFPETNIELLANQALTVEGGHAVTFYEYKEELQASVQSLNDAHKVYNRIPVVIEKGADLRSLPHLPKKIQKKRIHLQLAQGGKPTKVVIYKAAGLMGGMQEGDGGQEKEQKSNPNTEQASIGTLSLYAQAIKEEDQRMRSYIEGLLNSDFPINSQDDKGDTALHLAIKQADILLKERLRSLYIDIEDVDRGSLQYLIVKAIRKSYVPAISELIIKAGSVVKAENKDGFTAFHLAAENGHIEVFEYLVEQGADIEAKTKSGYTSLYLAAGCGHIEIVKYLIKQGADKEAKDKEGRHPLYLAAENGHIEVVKYLIEQEVDINATGKYGFPSLYIAAEKGHIEIVKYLIEQGADKNKMSYTTPLHEAARNGHIGVAEYLIGQGVDKEAKEFRFNRTPLHIAALHGHTEIVKYLIEQGADKEAKDNEDRTPLYLAACDHIEIVKYLIEQGADKEAKNREGATSLYRAAENSSIEMVKCLVEREVNINAKNNYHNTSVYIAAEKGHIEIVKYLIEQGADKEAKNNSGYAPLHIAANNGHIEVVQYLIDKGANKEARDKYGKKPISKATSSAIKKMLSGRLHD